MNLEVRNRRSIGGSTQPFHWPARATR